MDFITTSIATIFEANDAIPLYFIESGSRLWGIASPDSDYDVRGFHLQSKREAFDYKKHRDLIEIMDGDFDFVSYDIDKMFGLLATSNPTVFEWMRAHLIYYNNVPEWERLQKGVIENFDFKALFYHYLSLSRSQYKLLENNNKFTYKKVFYCIRGLLSAKLATEYTVPALLINELFDQFKTDNPLLSLAKESLERKKAQLEKQEIPEQDKPYILTTLSNYIDELVHSIPEPSNRRDKLEAILTESSILIKEKFYG